MKKYSICFFLFLAVSMVCTGTGYLAKQRYERQMAEQATVQETQSQAVSEEYMVANQQQVTHEAVPSEEFYLVSEDGFLLVFLKDKKTICLYTHVPLMDFPPVERDRLREGIWFSSMMEVFNYLESYTS